MRSATRKAITVRAPSPACATAISIVVTGPIPGTSSSTPAVTPSDTADGTPRIRNPLTQSSPTASAAAAWARM